MKKTLLWATIATLLFAACSKSEIVESTIEPSGDFVATLDNQSRTELNGTSVVWNAEDELTIFTKTEHNRHYKIKELSNNGRTATFGYVGFTGTSNGSISSNYVVYPYNAEATISGDVISTAIAAEQKYNAEKIDLSYALMVAKSQTTSFAFVNAGALMRFNVSKSELIPDSYTLSSIKLSSATNNIAGDVTIDLSAESRAIVASTGSQEITLTAINQEITTEAKSFYVALPAVSFADKDLTVTFTFADGEKSFDLPAFELEQGSIKTVAYTINDSEDFTGTTPGEAPKPANNEIFYTNGSTTEATTPNNTSVFGANIVSNTYDTQKSCWVIKFDGEVTAIGSKAFYQCSSLTSVIMPESVTYIGMDAFSECTGMQTLTLPLSITRFGDTYEACAFRNCTGKLTIHCNIPDSYYDMEDDEYNVFYSADFTDITIGDSVTTLGKNAFRSCSKLESITLGDNITTYGSNIFTGCMNLSKIYGKHASADNRCWITNGLLRFFAYKDLTAYNIPEDVKFIAGYAFYNCSALQSITIPESVTNINSYAFYNCSALQNIYVKSETPATLAGYAFYNTKNAQLYIPYKSALAYNTASGWMEYVLIPYDFENNKVYVPEQNPITYDWYTGAIGDVFKIDTPEELVALSKLTNGDIEALAAVGAESAITFEGKTIEIIADIDLSDVCSPLAGSWAPIQSFRGTFNGNNHTISNLYSKTTGSTGLFLSVSGATIKDITIHGTIISSEAGYVGGIASTASSTLFENCISAVNITTSTTGNFACSGGVVGYSNNSKYIACQSTGYICDTIDEWEWNDYVGGIAGNTSGGDKLIACIKPTGKVHEQTSQSYSPVGGILGCVNNFSDVSIRSCYTSISILGREPGHITNTGYYENYSPYAEIANCYYSGTPATSKGIGTRNYGGQHKSYDYGTARSTDIAAEIVIMNEGIDKWNAAHPECICNYKYALDENSRPKLVKQK